MKSSLTAAVVGTGFIGPVHVEALKRCGVHVRGILGSSSPKSIAAADRLGLEVGYASFDEVLNDSQVDVVHITSPNRFHFEQASKALHSGKHVMCEKPLAMDSKESAELVRIATASDTVAGVAYNIRFYPLCHEAAARVADVSFGDAIHVNGSYVQDWLLHQTDFNWRVSADDGGKLRALADIGTHWLDLVQFITKQKVVSVCANLQKVYSHRQRSVGGTETFSDSSSPRSGTESIEVVTEDAGDVLLQFADGAQGTLHVSQMTAGRKNCLRFEIAGTRQCLSFNTEQPNQIWVGHRDSPNELLIRDPSMMDASASIRSNYPAGHNEGFPDTFKQLFAAFYGYIEAGDFSASRPFPTFEDGHHEVLLCDAIFESDKQRGWVDVRLA